MSGFCSHAFSAAVLEGLRTKLTSKMSECIKDADDCLIWGGAKHESGYGLIWVNVTCLAGKVFHQNVRVHRLAYFLFVANGESIEDAISHMCHKKLCYNIGHLSLEPSAINNQRSNCKFRGQCCGHGTYAPCILK